MAVDKKSQHVGNHGGAYTDLYGHSKQFTYIDHDVKTKISTYAPTEEEKREQKAIEDKRRADRIDEILSLPAVCAVQSEDPFIKQVLYEEFVVRSPQGIKWNEIVLRNACSIDDELARALHLRVWRKTVKEQYWFEEMSHEDIMAGKWRDWM